MWNRGLPLPTFCTFLFKGLPLHIVQWGHQPKIWFDHNCWLEGPIDLRPTRLNCILALPDLFRAPTWPYLAPPNTRQNMPNMAKYAFLALLIWSSGVSLKRSCKMQFRRVGLRSIGPSIQKFVTFFSSNSQKMRDYGWTHKKINEKYGMLTFFHQELDLPFSIKNCMYYLLGQSLI